MADTPEDQPLSSEELLRRAREGLGDSASSTPPPSDFSIESYPPASEPMPEPTTSSVDDFGISDSKLEPSFTDDSPIVEDTPEVETEPETTSWAPPRTESDSTAGWAPPPPPNDDAPQWTAPAPGSQVPAPAQERRISARNAITVLVLLFFAGSFLFSIFDSSTTVDDISVGDCLQAPEDDEFNSVDVVDCTEAHDFEVFAAIDLSTVSNDFALAAPYPGALTVELAALEECDASFEAYVGVDYWDSVLEITTFMPTIEGWEEADDRLVQCLLFQPGAGEFGIIDSIRSFKNSGF